MKPLPPTLALKAAGSALLPVIVVGVGVVAVSGVVGLAWFLLGAVAALPVATHAVPWSDRVLLVGLGVVAAVLGLASIGRPLAAAAVVASVSLLQAPLSRRTPGGGAMVPVLAAVAASTGLPDERWTTALALVVGAGTIILTTTVLGIRTTPARVPAALAWRHAAALAVTAALALGLVMQQQVTHGYWLVLTLALVLRPARDETRTLARDRFAGTVIGLAAGVAAVVLLPTWAVLAVAAPCVLLTAAWGMAGDSPARDGVRRSAAGAARLVRARRVGRRARPGADRVHARRGRPRRSRGVRAGRRGPSRDARAGSRLTGSAPWRTRRRTGTGCRRGSRARWCSARRRPCWWSSWWRSGCWRPTTG